MVLPILVPGALAPETPLPGKVIQALWARVLAAGQRRRGANTVVRSTHGSPKVGSRDKLVHQWRRACRMPTRWARKWQAHAPRPPRPAGLPTPTSLEQQELQSECKRLMRLWLRNRRARMSRANRQAIRLATQPGNLRKAPIMMDATFADAAVWLLAAMHWWGHRDPGSIDMKPSHAPTGLMWWLTAYKPSVQLNCPREILGVLPLTMDRMEHRIRELVSTMIFRKGAVALLPELLLSMHPGLCYRTPSQYVDRRVLVHRGAEMDE
ncbi:hypothetical protein WKW80_35410 [Variovorax humicola]|uniref:Uncharacterized protein n=1 Tax=Variovorax humicola TaxID=1769758 RepID=A0ABU8WAY3_9BURK